MKEYDVFVPLRYNDGTDIELDKFKDLQRRLLEEFNGVTFFSQPNEGLWKMGEVVYHDEIVISPPPKSGRAYLTIVADWPTPSTACY